MFDDKKEEKRDKAESFRLRPREGGGAGGPVTQVRIAQDGWGRRRQTRNLSSRRSLQGEGNSSRLPSAARLMKFLISL